MGIISLVWFNRSMAVPVVVAGAARPMQFMAPAQFAQVVTRQESALGRVVGGQSEHSIPTRKGTDLSDMGDR